MVTRLIVHSVGRTTWIANGGSLCGADFRTNEAGVPPEHIRIRQLPVSRPHRRPRKALRMQSGPITLEVLDLETTNTKPSGKCSSKCTMQRPSTVSVGSRGGRISVPFFLWLPRKVWLFWSCNRLGAPLYPSDLPSPVPPSQSPFPPASSVLRYNNYHA